MKKLLFCGLLISCTVGVKADWYSNLYPARWTPGYTYGTQQYFLHDFSYAGYRMGTETIPSSVGNAYIDITQAPYNASGQRTAYNRTTVFQPGVYIVNVQTPQRSDLHKIIVY
jgi:hypothetical protein